LDRAGNHSDIGAKIVSGEATLEELAAYAETWAHPNSPAPASRNGWRPSLIRFYLDNHFTPKKGTVAKWKFCSSPFFVVMI